MALLSIQHPKKDQSSNVSFFSRMLSYYRSETNVPLTNLGDAKTFKKLHTFPGGRKGVKNFDGHTEDILCLALSFDGQYLASGGKDKVINIWSVKEDKHIVKFTQHRDAISVSSKLVESSFIKLTPVFDV